MKQYKEINMDIIWLNTDDIVRTSPNENDNVIEMPEYPENGNFMGN